MSATETNEDEWDFGGDDETLEIECDHCGEVKRCCRTTNPYMDEIHPEEPSEISYWCYQCWDNRHGDI